MLLDQDGTRQHRKEAEGKEETDSMDCGGVEFGEGGGQTIGLAGECE